MFGMGIRVFLVCFKHESSQLILPNPHVGDSKANISYAPQNPDLPGFIKSLTLSIQAPLPAIIPLDCLDLIENLPNLQHFNYNPQGWTQGNVPNTLKELPKDLDVQLSSLTLDLKDMRDPDFPKEFVYDFTQIPWLRCMRIINASDIFRIWEESPKRFPWKVLSVAKCYPTPGDWNINPAT